MKNNFVKSSILAGIFAAGLGTANIANAQETVIHERDGSITVVRTDSQGTRTFNNGRLLYSSGGDRHKEQVGHSERNNGGRVMGRESTGRPAGAEARGAGGGSRGNQGRGLKGGGLG